MARMGTRNYPVHGCRIESMLRTSGSDQMKSDAADFSGVIDDCDDLPGKHAFAGGFALVEFASSSRR